MKTLILAGGLGTRLRKVVSDRPKPMASIAGRPFLEHQINSLKKQGLEDIILGVGHMADDIKSHFGECIRHGVKITYSEEDAPLGTAGAIRLARGYLGDEPFFVLNGDTFSTLNLSRLLEFHESKKGAVGSISLVLVPDVSDYGGVLLSGDRIENFLEKGSQGEGLVNNGAYIFSKGILERIPSQGKVSLEETVLPEIALSGQLYGFPHDGHFIDIGRPETYFQFRQDLIQELSASQDITVREALRHIRNSGSDILYLTEEDGVLAGIANSSILMRYITDGGDLEHSIGDAMVIDPTVMGSTSDSENDIQRLLETGTSIVPILDEGRMVVDMRFRKDTASIKTIFPTVSGKAPLRISFAGGGTDLEYHFKDHGGEVISTTIDKYVHLIASRRADKILTIVSDNNSDPVILEGANLEYNGEFDIVKAAYTLVNPGFGVDFFLRNDIPPGRGLGSSASLATLVVKTLGELGGLGFAKKKIAEIAYEAEVSELGIKGGQQDQYAAVYGGFNWMEFERDDITMNPLGLGDESRHEFLSHITLCYTGSSHDSGSQHEAQQRAYTNNFHDNIERLNRIKVSAEKFRRNLFSTQPNFRELGNIIGRSWEDKRLLSLDVSNEKIDGLYGVGIQEGCYGGKLLGSGGGGYLLFIHPPKLTNKIRDALRNGGGEIMNFNFESKGAKTWNTYK
ncbi:MAG: NTP transferase domain-containing protein [Nanoarchaeota archaeon]|nr:NTP transferase domain-containing protein [Nanoarchaeota archaeon]